MLAPRLIPCLDIKDGRVVKGVRFQNLRDAGDPVYQASIYQDQGADEIVILDISATPEGRGHAVETTSKVRQVLSIPLTVGGGVREVDDVAMLLEAGADKVAVNSAAVASPQLIEDCAREFGSQCVVLAMDVKRVEDPVISEIEGYGSVPAEAMWQIYTHGGRRPTAFDAIKWARLATENGAGELLVTSMDADGQKTGYDNELLSVISDSVTVPVIASGGAGALDHFYDALVVGKSDAVLAASVFHFGELRVSEVKSYLGERGIPVREA